MASGAALALATVWPLLQIAGFLSGGSTVGFPRPAPLAAPDTTSIPDASGGQVISPGPDEAGGSQYPTLTGPFAQAAEAMKLFASGNDPPAPPASGSTGESTSPSGGGAPSSSGQAGGQSPSQGDAYPWIQVESIAVSASPCSFDPANDESSCTVRVTMWTNSSAGTVDWWLHAQVETGCTSQVGDSGTQATELRGGQSPVVESFTFTFQGEVDGTLAPAPSTVTGFATAAGNAYPVHDTAPMSGSGSCLA